MKKINYKCLECGLITQTFLKDKNPFNKEEEIYGCPNCFSVNT